MKRWPETPSRDDAWEARGAALAVGSLGFGRSELLSMMAQEVRSVEVVLWADLTEVGSLR